MALIDRIKETCDRLAQKGWDDLFAHHNLNITASDLAEELNSNIANFAGAA